MVAIIYGSIVICKLALVRNHKIQYIAFIIEVIELIFIRHPLQNEILLSIISVTPVPAFRGQYLTEVSFNSADPLTGAKPIYRFLNTSTGTHLYTISEVEKDLIEDNLFSYSSEGIAYYGYEDRQPGTTPMYRLYNDKSNTHLFTSSIAEKNEVLASDDYRLEGNNGVAFYVESLTDI